VPNRSTWGVSESTAPADGNSSISVSCLPSLSVELEKAAFGEGETDICSPVQRPFLDARFIAYLVFWLFDELATQTFRLILYIVRTDIAVAPVTRNYGNPGPQGGGHTGIAGMPPRSAWSREHSEWVPSGIRQRQVSPLHLDIQH
jgi:hypothetical protein